MKYIVALNGKNYEVDVTETTAEIVSVSDAAPVVAAPVAAPVSAPVAAPAAAPVAAAPAVAGAGEKVVSPMPGTILSCNVAAGQTVAAGEVMFILEAMKMENEIVAPCAGTVKQVLVSKGSTVDTDAVLAVI